MQRQLAFAGRVMLGAIKRKVGIFQQPRRILAILRRERDAHARPRDDAIPLAAKDRGSSARLHRSSLFIT